MSCRFNLSGIRKISSPNSKQGTYFTNEDTKKVYEVFPYSTANYIMADKCNMVYVSVTTKQDAEKVLDFMKSIKGNTSKFVLAFWEGEYRTDAFILDDIKSVLKYMEKSFNDRWATFGQSKITYIPPNK